MGYHNIDAVDWTREAWDTFVIRKPSTVTFYEMDVDSFRKNIWRKDSLSKYDAINFNFAVNESKAISYAKEMLSSSNGILLAPVNTQRDYWLNQAYKVYDSNGNMIRLIGDNVGAWNVQFQPDVSEETCTEIIWCPPFNSFKKIK